MGFETAAILLSWIANALLGLALAGLMRQVHWLVSANQPLDRLGPGVGTRAPVLAGVSYTESERTLIIFMADNCPLCADLTPTAQSLALTATHEGAQVLIARIGTEGAEHPGTGRMTQDDLRLWRISFTPFAVIVASDSRVLDARPVDSVETLRALVTRTTETRKEIAA